MREHDSVELAPRLTLFAAHAIRALSLPRAARSVRLPSLTSKTIRLVWSVNVRSDG